MRYDRFSIETFYPNQRQVMIKRESVAQNSTRKYLCAYTDNIINAMNELSPSAFKVYIAMISNKDGYKMEFSPAYLEKVCNIHRDTARKAFKEMEIKKFIRIYDAEKNLYQFSENPIIEDITNSSIYN